MCLGFGGGLKIIFSLGNGVFLRSLTLLCNLGDLRGRLFVVFANLSDRRGEMDSSSPFLSGDFVGVMLEINAIKGMKVNK